MGHIGCFTFLTFSNYVYQFTHAHPGSPVAIIATYLDDANPAGLALTGQIAPTEPRA